MLAVLIFAALVIVMISVASAVLTAGGRPSLAMVAALPAAPLALVGHLLVIPRFGSIGATGVTLIVATVGALIAIVAVWRTWRLWPPVGTAVRSIIVTVIVTVGGTAWRTMGALVFVELGVMSLVACVLLALFGELSPTERAALGLAAQRFLPAPVSRVD